VFEAQSAKAFGPGVDAVAIEVDDVIRPAGLPRAIQITEQRGKRGRVQQAKPHQPAQVLHGLDQWLGARAVIDVGTGVIFRSRGDQQDADGRVDRRNVQNAGVGQPPPDADRPGTLEQEPAAVVHQLPGQAEQGCGGLAGDLIPIRNL
jgi:hypothetical protein